MTAQFMRFWRPRCAAFAPEGQSCNPPPISSLQYAASRLVQSPHPRPFRLARQLPCSGVAMKDIVLVLVTVGFFAVSWLYTRSLDRL